MQRVGIWTLIQRLLPFKMMLVTNFLKRTAYAELSTWKFQATSNLAKFSRACSWAVSIRSEWLYPFGFQRLHPILSIHEKIQLSKLFRTALGTHFNVFFQKTFVSLKLKNNFRNHEWLLFVVRVPQYELRGCFNPSDQLGEFKRQWYWTLLPRSELGLIIESTRIECVCGHWLALKMIRRSASAYWTLFNQ